jgi:hypothetical protein
MGSRRPAGVSDLPELPPEAFARVDESDDAEFYVPARLVTHIDEGAIAALGDFYAATLPRGGVLLDLMSSWVSHLPADFAVSELVGHGMNADELATNPRLTDRFVQDLNREPALPLADARFDGAMCCVSVQYLQRPIEVFAEVRRVLKPGAPFIVSFSNRCFPTKAVAVWRALDINGHAALVHLYMERGGFSGVAVRGLADGSRCDPLVAVIGRA